MRKVLLILGVFLLLFLPLLTLNAEEEPVGCDKPEPFVDYEFEELQKTFLQKRKVKLATMKKLPLNQYPEEFILELIQQIKEQVKKEIRKDYQKNLKNLNRREAAIRKSLESPQKTTDSSMKNLFEDKKNVEKKAEKTETKDEKPVTVVIPEGKEDKRTLPPKEENKKPVVNTQGNQIVKFDLNTPDAFIGINSLSKLMMTIKVKAVPQIAFVDVAIYVRNVTSSMVYLLKRYPMTAMNGSKSINFLWEYPNIPFGKYKPYVIVRFHNNAKQYVSQDSQNWGNSSSDKLYILFKN